MKRPNSFLPFDCKCLKLISGCDGLAERLVKHAQKRRRFRIITFTLTPTDYIIPRLLRTPMNPTVEIIAHRDRRSEAARLNRFSEVRIRLHPAVHSKVVLIEPDIVIVGSHNFRESDWHDTSVQIRSPEVHDWYLANEWKQLWKEAEHVDKPKEEKGFLDRAAYEAYMRGERL